MAALLERFGAAFYHQVLHLRLEEGLKGEAAMCHLLGLAGDPYAVLLTLEGGELAPLAWQPRTTAPTALRTPIPIPVPLPATSTGPSALSHEHPLYQRHSPVCPAARHDRRPGALSGARRPGADALYVLGDLFEFWIGDDDPNPLHGEVADAFAALSQQGVPSTSFMATATSCWARPLPSAPA